MPTRSTPWPAGTPCWTDNHVPDLAAARAFYGAVLDWQIDDPDPGAGNFACARSAGRAVAGFLVAVAGAQPGWHVYFATENSTASAAAIERHGGASLFGPHDVPPDRGRFQLASDPTGAVFGVWQAGSLTGTGVHGEHGSFGWADLRSRRPSVARAFYADVFGFAVQPLPGGDPAAESHWVPYFVVDDVDAAIIAATSNGGAAAEPARDTPSGRIARVSDPFGAGFSIASPEGSHRIPSRRQDGAETARPTASP